MPYPNHQVLAKEFGTACMRRVYMRLTEKSILLGGFHYWRLWLPTDICFFRQYFAGHAIGFLEGESWIPGESLVRLVHIVAFL